MILILILMISLSLYGPFLLESYQWTTFTRKQCKARARLPGFWHGARHDYDSDGGMLMTQFLFVSFNINMLSISAKSCGLPADSGLVVPSVSYELHQRLLAAAERWGLSVERRLETIGVCASQMALTLLGGPNR